MQLWPLAVPSWLNRWSNRGCRPKAAARFAESLARGETDRGKIVSTIFKDDDS
jgi:hypothetical protein